MFLSESLSASPSLTRMDTVLRVSNTGVTGTPNRTLTGRHQPRPKGEMRRVVRLDVPFRVAISQPQLNTDGYGFTRIKHRSHWDTESDPYRETPAKTAGSISGHGGCPAPCPRRRKKYKWTQGLPRAVSKA